MSFSIDLWNGSNKIKNSYNNLRQKYRSFNNFLVKYNTIESQHCKNLDNLYNEFKESEENKSNFDLARINIIEMINYESQLKKNFIENINEIIKNINIFLQDLKNNSNEITDLTENFAKELDKLNSKKQTFYFQCKEMSSLLSQFELENKLNDINNEQKLNKTLAKIIKTREEYLISINEANIKRRYYNTKISDILDKYEKEYKDIIENFRITLNDVKTKKYEMINLIHEREKNDFISIFTKLNTDEEIIEFIINNVTKEFPMTQIEFCPFKNKDFEIFLNSKYQNKLNKNDLKRIMTTINKYFQKNNIFPLNYVQTRISRIEKTHKDNFFNVRRLSLFIKNNNENNNENPWLKSIKEKELKIVKNYEFVKNIINELITNNKVQIFESKYAIEGDIPNFKEEIKKFKKLENINEKEKELKSLLDRKNESHLVYTEALIKTLSFLRSKGYFEINEQNYNIITDIFGKILEQNRDNGYILKNLLILSQTFYKIVDGEKIYIQEKIKENPVLILARTWHRCINYSLKYSNKDIKFNNKNEYLEKINRDAYTTVITYLCDLKTFTDNEKCYKDVSYFYSRIYNIKEEDIKATVEKSIKSRRSLKEIKEEEERLNKIKEDKKGTINEEENINKNEIKEEMMNTIEINIETKNKNENIEEMQNIIEDKDENINKIKDENKGDSIDINEEKEKMELKIENEEKEENKNIIENKEENINNIENKEENINKNRDIDKKEEIITKNEDNEKYFDKNEDKENKNQIIQNEIKDKELKENQDNNTNDNKNEITNNFNEINIQKTDDFL